MIIKECDFSIFPVNEIKETLDNLLERKDIYHQDLFIAINQLFTDKELKSILDSGLNIIDNNNSNKLLKENLIIKSLPLLTYNSIIWEQVLYYMGTST